MTTTVLLLCLFFISQVLAIPPRVLQGCTTLGSNVYCVGGYRSGLGGRFVNATNEIYTFNMALVYTYSSRPSSISWSLVNTSSSVIEPRASMAIASLNKTHYMISGGESDDNSLKNSTIIFDSSTDTSTVLSSPPSSTYDGTLVATNSNTVWGYGGKLQNSTDPASNSTFRLDLSTLPGTWTTQIKSAYAPSSNRYGHAAVVRKTMIYYFGGFMAPKSINSTSQPISLKSIDFYNTVTDQWGVISAAGATPNTRKHHTATLIGTSSVLIYGGTGFDQPQSLPTLDIAYTFDLDDQIYRKIDLNSVDGAGPRSGHSAVLFDDNVFILFGYDSSGNIKNDVHILDVSDPTDPVWAGSRTAFGDSPTINDGSNRIKIIIGTVVGGVVLILIIACAIIYSRMKRNQRAAVPYQQQYLPPHQNNYAELVPISSSASPNHGHNTNNNGTAASDMITNFDQPTEYPSEPAPRYSLHAPPVSYQRIINDGEISKTYPPPPR
ncbi:hypothetical protein BCR42DRAFT_401435 [Absidia repens]|uniref:Galactose oxidase n=1 Tax=Absidia repens TaxID=90262 RepID=A0A1X2J2K1_9FUNG|nr:hypothetical protein BCR42DRAFT_401435 [Absidia repens]